MKSCRDPDRFVLKPIPESAHLRGMREVKLRPCGRCDRCMSQKRKDFAARCVMEGRYADWSCMVTLTYAPDVEPDGFKLDVRRDMADKVPTKEHFQRWIRALRDRWRKDGNGASARYAVVCELGGLHGRVHFHALLFGKGPAPSWPEDGERFHMRQWPHGHCQVEWSVGVRNAFYVAKYIHKDAAAPWSSRSNRPIFGGEGLAAHARACAEAGHLPANGCVMVGRFENGNEFWATFNGRARQFMVGAAVAHGAAIGRPLSAANCSALVLNDVKRLYDAKAKRLRETHERLDPAALLADLVRRHAEKQTPYERRRATPERMLRKRAEPP